MNLLKTTNWQNFFLVVGGAFVATFATSFGLSLQSITTFAEVKPAMAVAGAQAAAATLLAISGFFTKRDKPENTIAMDEAAKAPAPVPPPAPDPRAARAAMLRAELAMLEETP